MPWLSDPEAHDDLTYADAFLSPYNPLEDRLLEVATTAEKKELQKIRKEAFDAGNETLKKSGKRKQLAQAKALSSLKHYRSIVMKLAQKYPDSATDISRDDVDIRPIDGFGNIPIVIANMNAVVGKRMGETLGMMGGRAAIPQDKEDEEMEDIAEYMHSRDVRYMTPTTVGPETRIHELKEYLEKRDFDTAIVADAKGKMLGLVRFQRTPSEPIEPGVIPLGVNVDQPVRKYMRTEGWITAPVGTSSEEAYAIMQRERIHFLPVQDRQGRIKGVLTEKFLGWQWRYQPHVDEEHGGLAILATIGAVNKNPVDRAKFFIEDLGVAGILMDTAHMDQGIQTYRNTEAVANFIQKSRQKVKLIAGNTVTREGIRAILGSGADIGKVGVGPGAMCTTRIETANGRPQLSAVQECAEEADKYGGHIWADGGVVHPRDVALALAAGASQVMIGSLFTPTLESPGKFERDDRGDYKVNYGMASRRASDLRHISARARTDIRSLFRRVMGQRAEGISDSNVYVKDGRRSAVDLVHYIMDGVTSAMTYAGARNLDEFRRYAHIGIQTPSGYEEGKAKSAL